MKNKRNVSDINQVRYIVVGVDQITRESYFDGCKINDIENVCEIFDEKNIPKEFQKLIIFINPLFKFNSIHDYYEYTLGFPFYLDIINDETDKGKKYLVGNSKTNDIYNNLRMNNKISFKIEARVYSEETINKFFKDMNDSGYLELYLECIKDMFWKLSFKNVLNIKNEKMESDKKIRTRKK